MVTVYIEEEDIQKQNAYIKKLSIFYTNSHTMHHQMTCILTDGQVNRRHVNQNSSILCTYMTYKEHITCTPVVSHSSQM